MHGRIPILAALAALLLCCALAAPALAARQPPFTAPCLADTQYRCIGLDDSAMWEGTVSRWRVRSATAQSGVRLQSVLKLSGNRTVFVATSAPFDVAAGETKEVAGPLTLLGGSVLELTGTTGPTDFEADVAPDTTVPGGNGCPGNFSPLPCLISTFGSPLLAAPDATGFPAATDAVQLVAPGMGSAGAPRDGVVVRWRVRSATTDPLALQVVHGGAVAGTSAPAVPAAGGAPTTFDTRLPIAKGDLLGLHAVSGMVAAVAEIPFLSVTGTPAEQSGWRLLVNADIEPDDDRDGYGDFTQDACPENPALHAGCMADLTISGSTPTLQDDGSMLYAFAVENRGPDLALGVDVHIAMPAGAVFVDTGYAQGCVATGSALDCHEGRFAAAPPGLFLHVVLPAALVQNGVAATATVTAATADPNPTNNALTLTSQARQPWLGLIASIHGNVTGACETVLRGTARANTLRGSADGDRILGLAGKDKLYGRGGDDCLSGGTGDDLLDGGPGDDTLTGGAGRDHLLGGAGKDIINAVDGTKDTIDCGPGKDTVRADKRDRVVHCEKVTRRR